MTSQKRVPVRLSPPALAYIKPVHLRSSDITRGRVRETRQVVRSSPKSSTEPSQASRPFWVAALTYHFYIRRRQDRCPHTHIRVRPCLRMRLTSLFLNYTGTKCLWRIRSMDIRSRTCTRGVDRLDKTLQVERKTPPTSATAYPLRPPQPSAEANFLGTGARSGAEMLIFRPTRLESVKVESTRSGETEPTLIAR